MDLDLGVLKKSGHAAPAISHASVMVPFLLGSGLALWLYPVLSSSDIPFTVFALFVGVSLSVTAFPVLARILTDRNISRSPNGGTRPRLRGNLGLDLGVISPKLVTMLVIMAIVTTFLTTRILQMLLRKHPWIERKAAPAFGGLGEPAGVKTPA